MTKTNRHVQNMTNINKTGRKCVKLSFNKYAHSSNVNEVIRAILNPFIFFLQEDFTHIKSTKCIQVNKNKKGSIFMRIKNI